MHDSNHQVPTDARSGELEQQIATLETLRECLEDEHRALQVRDPEQLLSIAGRKAACLTEAGRIHQKRSEPRSGNAMRATITSSDTGKKQRERLDTLTRVCRDLNVANGSLISRQKVRIEKTLQIMRGEPERSHLYGPTGTTTNRNSARRLLTSI